MLNGLKLKRKPTPQTKLVYSVLIRRSDFIYTASFEIIKHSHSFNQPINLGTICIQVYFDLLIENSLLTVWDQVDELIFVDLEFR